MSFSPTLINDHAGGRPYYLFISLAIETELGKVIYFNMDKERNLATVLQTHFLRFREGFVKIPKEVFVVKKFIIFSDQLNMNKVELKQLPNITNFKGGIKYLSLSSQS